MSKIYTKTGDEGKTRLWDGTLVGKNDLHIETNGALDELNAALGLAKSLAPSSIKEELNGLQNRMVTLMSYIARGKKKMAPPDPADLEAWIDRITADYPLGGKLVTPGESQAGAAIHLARSIARRAERKALRIMETGGDVEPMAYQFINRLSDLLFALAHKADIESGADNTGSDKNTRT